MLSKSKGTFDYKVATPFSGTYKSQITSVQPYLSWFVSQNLSVWGSAGYGWGEIAINDKQAGKGTSDMAMQTAALGIRGKLISIKDLIADGETSLHLNSDISYAHVNTERAKLADPMTANIWRVRLATEGKHEQILSTATSLATSIELGLRHDGGDGVTGFGLEVGGGLKYINRSLGLTLASNGRVLVSHRADYDEWGGDFLVLLDSGADGLGFSFSIAPGYGTPRSGVAQLWDQGMADRTANNNTPGGWIDFEIGYGLGLAAPGSPFKSGPRFEMTLNGLLKESSSDAPEHEIMLKGQLHF